MTTKISIKAQQTLLMHIYLNQLNASFVILNEVKNLDRFFDRLNRDPSAEFILE